MISEQINCVMCSRKCIDLFQAFRQEDESINLWKLCPTWWTLRASSVLSVIRNYSHLIMFLHDLASGEQNDAGPKASGFVKSITYLMLQLLKVVFSRLETVSAAFAENSIEI